MDWTQTLTIIGTVVASAYFIHRDIHLDMKQVQSRIDQCNIRTDKLYEMFIELVKTKKDS